MCVITDENNVVKSVSLIPGIGYLPEGWHCYFPVDEIPEIGSIYTEI